MVRSIAIVALLFSTPAFAQPPKKPAPRTGAKTPAKKATATKPPEPAPPPPPPDLAITAQYVTGDKTTTSTVTLHGARQRVDYESALATIQECDNSQSIQLNTQTRTFWSIPFSSTSNAAPRVATGGKQKGGTITYTTAVVDTGERKEMFGMPARHLKTTITKASSADACDKQPEKVEIDGWYVDLPPTLACTAVPAPEKEIRVDPKDASCRDVVSYVRASAPTGYPVAYTMAAASGSGATATTEMKTGDVKHLAADAAQFDVPADYVAVKSVAQLTADHRPGEDGPKKPGVPRVGVAPLRNKSGQQASTAVLADALVESFGEAEVDAVLLKQETPAAQAEEAKARSCDFILQNTIAEMKRPGKGMLGKLSGTSADAFAARVDFTLAPVGGASPLFADSEKSGTSMLQTAVGTAKRVSQFVTPFMMARYGYLKAFEMMSGNAAPAMMQQTQDPVLSSIFSLVDRATGANKAQPLPTSEDEAAATALLKEVSAVASKLKPKKTTD
jgi:hypothetical protein